MKKTRRHLLPYARWHAGVLCTSFALFSGCAVGGHHTRDSQLIQMFYSHETQFESLLAEVSSDQNLHSLSPRLIHYAGGIYRAQGDGMQLQRLGLSIERQEDYRRQLQDLGLAQVTKGGNKVEFRVDNGSLLNGDSYKSIVYVLSAPEGYMKSSLDGYRISAQDKGRYGTVQVYRQIKDHWYLYLFVNG